MVITRGRWSSPSTSMLSVSACRRAITCAWHCCGSNRVTGLPTLPANRCPFSWCRELARFTEDFGEAVRESVEATARSSVWQRPTKHLEHMLSSEQRIEHSVEASSKLNG